MIQFSDTDTLKGLAQLYAEEIGMDNPTDLTSNTTKMKKFTAQVNLALDSYFRLAIEASGKWQLDDSNHTDYPIITTNLVAGQRSYVFLTDESGNAILDIYKVFVKNTSTGSYEEIYPVDVQSESDTGSFADGENQQGTVYRYDKTSNAIFLDLIPTDNITNGLKVYINRESSYFTYTDTTKKPGFPYHQEYFYLKPAYNYARINTLAILPRLEQQVLKLEGDPTRGIVGLIARAYGARAKDEGNFVLKAEEINPL